MPSPLFLPHHMSYFLRSAAIPIPFHCWSSFFQYWRSSPLIPHSLLHLLNLPSRSLGLSTVRTLELPWWLLWCRGYHELNPLLLLFHAFYALIASPIRQLINHAHFFTLGFNAQIHSLKKNFGSMPRNFNISYPKSQSPKKEPSSKAPLPVLNPKCFATCQPTGAPTSLPRDIQGGRSRIRYARK